MKTNIRFFLASCIGLVLWGCANGQINPAINALDSRPSFIATAQADLIFEYAKDFPNNTQMAIGIIRNGQTDFFGIERVNDTIRLIENQQLIFEIGSITKVFTATLLSNFVMEEKLQLDDAIQEYLDIKIQLDEPITFAQLANHTSGLPRMPSNLNLFFVDRDNPYKAYGKEKMLEYLSTEIELDSPPGEKYAYSNLGAGLLGFGLAEIANSSYEELLQEKIFKKYGMTYSTSQRERLTATLVPGLDPEGKPTSNWDFDALAGGGAIFSSIADLSKFALAQFDAHNQELALTQQPTFDVNENLRMGLGWHLLKRKKGGELVWHNGGTGGYSSSMGLETTKKIGIIILSNVSAFHKKMGNIDQLCFGLVNTLDE